ncbi:MAG: galactokinase family protein [Acidobacteriota bacterium]
MRRNVKTAPMKFLSVSAPGRICLFGEHSDYMKLPVIASAINLRIRISGTPRNDKRFNINLPDINDYEVFEVEGKVPYQKERDYWRSVVNVLQNKAIKITHGFDCEVHSEIPMRGGCSSSSALVVAWTKFLLTAFNDPRFNDLEQIALFSYEAEVLEFGEPGGWMDHFAIALGGVNYIDCGVNPSIIKRLPSRLGKFVIGDSLQPKDTLTLLKKLRYGRLDVIKKLEPDLNLEKLRFFKEQDVKRFSNKLSPEEGLLLKGTIKNRDYVNEGLKILSKKEVDPKIFGQFLDMQHQLLRDMFKTSTPVINRMLNLAKQKGAHGGKISGSGGGGCMFAYAPESFMDVANIIVSEGKKAFVVDVASGVRVDEILL